MRGFAVLLMALILAGCAGPPPEATQPPRPRPTPSQTVTLFLAGDVMTGRGVDQILPHPSDPTLHEPYVQDARGYVVLAERAHGPIPKPADFAYIWGDALEEWARRAPDVRVVNLETSITASRDYWKDKGIHYRMHPDNVPCLTAAGFQCCVLANNHVLDWGYAGLEETLDVLHRAGIQTAGAGRTLEEAQAPAVVEVPGKGRVLVFAYGFVTGGVPSNWAATAESPGVHLLPDLSAETLEQVRQAIAAAKKPGDVVVVSLHWGNNWGYSVYPEERAFARHLIDDAGADVVHGHSSHHPKGMEVYAGKWILYGAGDLINDYEGIPGYEPFRPDLTLLYFAQVDVATGALVGVEMVPMQMRRFRLQRATDADARWLQEVLARETRGARVELGPEGTLVLRWD